MPKRILKGIVVSNKSNNTLSVKVSGFRKHALYNKLKKVSKKYAVHYVSGEYNVGDMVNIIECAPISKTKKFIILN